MRRSDRVVTLHISKVDGILYYEYLERKQNKNLYLDLHMGKFNINLTSDGWGPVLVHSVTFIQAGSCAQFPVQNKGHLL